MADEVCWRLAATLHEGQVDKGGQPYIGHLHRVAAAVARDGGDEHAVAAAWLHDAVEDQGVTPATLAGMGVPTQVIEIVAVLTRGDGEPYLDYVRRCAAHPQARRVKAADVADNSDPERLALLPEGERARLTRKYEQAREALAGP